MKGESGVLEIREADRHVQNEGPVAHDQVRGELFSHALKSIEQPVIEIELGDVFNEVIRSFTPGTFHIVESDPPEMRRRKLANFLAHAHHLEKRVARSFAYHIDACERSGRHGIAQLVARTRHDEEGHVRYTRAAVFEHAVPRNPGNSRTLAVK